MKVENWLRLQSGQASFANLSFVWSAVQSPLHFLCNHHFTIVCVITEIMWTVNSEHTFT